MRRTSIQAVELAQAADVSRRQIESWTGQGLGASGSSLPDQVRHMRALAEVVRPGRGNNPNKAALRMAARGYTCDRLRQALLETMGLPTEPSLIATPNLDDDANFAGLEHAVDALVPLGRTAPPELRPVIIAMRRLMNQVLGLGPAGGDDLLRQALLNIAASIAGSGIYDVAPLAVFFGVPAADIDPRFIDQVNEIFVLDPATIEAVYRNEPLSNIIFVASWLREHAQLASTSFPTIVLSDSVVEILPTLAAPLVPHLLRCLAAHHGPGQPLLMQLALPQAVAAAVLEHLPLPAEPKGAGP